jgi:signal transduction histidine kinase
MRDDADAQSSIDGLQDQLSAALQELREVARGIYPPLLDEAGLGPALREVADRLPVAVHLDAPDERFGTAVEGAVYFALTDCLTALAPGAGPVTLTLRRDGDELVVLAGGVPHGAVADLVHRLRPLGGHATAPAEPGGRSPQLPVEVRIPCE